MLKCAKGKTLTNFHCSIRKVGASEAFSYGVGSLLSVFSCKQLKKIWKSLKI